MIPKEARNKYQREYYQKNKSKIKAIVSKSHNKTNYSEKLKLRRLEAKKKIISHYGGKCSCCGEEEIQFLTLEHMNGNGREERKSIGKSKNDSFRLYLHLIKNNYPKGYDILCFNCNIAKGLYGECPHKKV